MLIVFAGLPGTGKTTVAKALARKLTAVYLRIDTFEQAFIASGHDADAVGAAGYLAAYAVAKENLQLGLKVVADSVNSLNLTRDAWRNVARQAGAPIVEVELICSDTIVHRQRVEERQADIPGHTLPTWDSVMNRQYDTWTAERVVIDTARLTVDEAVETILRRLSPPVDRMFDL